MRPSVYVTRQLPEAGLNILKDTYQVTVFDGSHPTGRKIGRKELEDGVRQTDALVCLLSDTIDAALMDHAGRLKVIANYAVGYNNIDVAAARQRKIMVTHTPGVLTNATADLAFTLLMTLTRRIIPADRFVRDRQFVGWGPLLFLGDELAGKTLGIVGMGRIGQDMAVKCRAFGMAICYHNRRPLDSQTEKQLGATYYPTLDELLTQADVLSIHTPLTEETRHLFNRNTFGRMKPGAYLINTARGEIIDEQALAEALSSGALKGAGLDVYEFEPSVTESLLAMDNVVLLPHIGSATFETRDKMAVMVAKNVIAALEGRCPENLVPEMAAEDIFK